MGLLSVVGVVQVQVGVEELALVEVVGEFQLCVVVQVWVFLVFLEGT